MEGNTALAFGMVCGAGACTSLGAAAAFVVNLEVCARLAACRGMLRASCACVREHAMSSASLQSRTGVDWPRALREVLLDAGALSVAGCSWPPRLNQHSYRHLLITPERYLMRVQSKRFLAVSLALSCGVMFYVSMVEIFVKSLGAFRCELLILGSRALPQITESLI